MTGSIEKRGKNSYRLVVFKGYDLDGRPIRHQKTIHCKKKSEAQIELAKFLTEVESGLIRRKHPNICTICRNMDKRLCIKRTSTINLLQIQTHARNKDHSIFWTL